MKCKFYDCGWCYCQSGRSNDDFGECKEPDYCDEYHIKLKEIEESGDE